MKTQAISNIKTLYLIGNGFDLHHSIPSGYSHFCNWLQHRHPMLYEEFLLVYGPDVLKDEWWGNFENNLGQLDIVDFYERCHTEIPKEIWDEYHKHKGSGLPNGVSWHPAGNRLDSLYFVLNAVMRQWIAEISMAIYPSTCLQLPTDAFYITFNYTNVLEHIYQIPHHNILHIHGSLENGDEIIFGHGLTSLEVERQYDKSAQLVPDNDDIQKIQIVFGDKQKNPNQYISKYREIFSSFRNVEKIYVLGLSFSDVDIPYIKELARITNADLWAVYYHSEEDKERALKAFRENCSNIIPKVKLYKW